MTYLKRVDSQKEDEAVSKKYKRENLKVTELTQRSNKVNL